MEYIRLGASGLTVSRLALGCMTYGEVREGTPQQWALSEDESLPFFKQALDLGINFFDTANFYSHGSSEEIVGRALGKLARREDVVIATKVYFPMRPGPLSGGLSRREILSEVDASLRRLGVDHIDLYITHRWDPNTPIEETLEALNDVVRAGKVRYIGASSMRAWQFVKAQYTAKLHGWAQFVSMQNHYNLIAREEEREMIPYCVDAGVGVTPWSPLARGALAREQNSGHDSKREATDKVKALLYRATEDADRNVVEALGRVAAERGVPRAQIAMAWLLGRPGVTAPIVGPSKPHHLADAAAALDVALTPEEREQLEAPYAPHQSAELL